MTGPTRVDLAAWLDDRRAALDAYMAPWFADAWPAAFGEPLRYPLFGGGKRVRPALVLAAYEAVAPAPDDLSPALPAAAALELVHTYSLVHDDLPAMDDDDERRGRPTVHVAYDQPTAILVGDALLTEAFDVLARADLPADVRIALVGRLARAAGYRGMVGGQVADITYGADLDVDTLTRLHRLKTGALLEASAWAGGTVGGASADQLRALDAYGRAVGLAFQLADDVLDLEEDAVEGGPPSFATLLGVDETRARARALCDEACRAIADLPRPQVLVALARYVVDRTH